MEPVGLNLIKSLVYPGALDFFLLQQGPVEPQSDKWISALDRASHILKVHVKFLVIFSKRRFSLSIQWHTHASIVL